MRLTRCVGSTSRQRSCSMIYRSPPTPAIGPGSHARLPQAIHAGAFSFSGPSNLQPQAPGPCGREETTRERLTHSAGASDDIYRYLITDGLSDFNRPKS